MTRSRTSVLAAVAAALHVALNWVFADGLFGPVFWDGQDIAASAIFTYLLLALIVLVGVVQARSLPAEGVSLRAPDVDAAPGQLDDPVWWRLLLGNTYLALFWLPVRFFVGREWLSAGEHELRDPGRMAGGGALRGSWQGAVAIPPEGRPRITYGWFRDLLQYMLDNGWHGWFAPLVAIGEVLVGIGPIIGALVGIAAFVGTFMNFNFLLAGTASTNPVLFGLGVFPVLAWKVAGWWGPDRRLLPLLGTPWRPGRVFAQGAGGQTPLDRQTARA